MMNAPRKSYRYYLAGIWLCLCALAAPAAVEDTDTPAAAVTMLQEMSYRTLVLLEEKQLTFEENPAEVFRIVDEIVLPHFDFPRMAKLVLRTNWEAAAPEQRERFINEFRALLVRTYAISLAGYAKEQITIQPVSATPDARRIKVSTLVQKTGSSLAIPIDYELYRTDTEWKVFNVIVDGFSLVTNCRNDFDDTIKSKGLDELIKDLQGISDAQGGKH